MIELALGNLDGAGLKKPELIKKLTFPQKNNVHVNFYMKTMITILIFFL